MAWRIAVSFALLLSQALISAQASFADQNSLHDERPILQKSLVEKVNNHPKAMWKAGLNPRFINSTIGDFKRLLGSYLDDREGPVSVPRSPSPSLKLPKSFDAREAWPECISLKTILDQGHCGSCWAFAAAEALSDRFCIHYNESVILSVNDLLSCCGFECGFGCNGGFPLGAWQYFVRSGIVTQECNPYFDSVGCQHPGCEPMYTTPECVSQCTDNSTDWLSTKYYASSAYGVGSDPDEIMAELYTNGPIEVSFQVYEDFAHYKSGVYHHISGSYLGGHAVKLIGWGSTDEGVDYWILANSWNTDWGQDGYFYIQRGVNECGIESSAVAGMPASKQSLIASQ